MGAIVIALIAVGAIAVDVAIDVPVNGGIIGANDFVVNFNVVEGDDTNVACCFTSENMCLKRAKNSTLYAAIPPVMESLTTLGAYLRVPQIILAGIATPDTIK